MTEFEKACGRAAEMYLAEILKPPLLHGDEKHQEWLRTELQATKPLFVQACAASLRTVFEGMERERGDLKEELQHVLNDWNALVKASGSPTNGGAVGHVNNLRLERDRMRELIRRCTSEADDFPTQAEFWAALAPQPAATQPEEDINEWYGHGATQPQEKK